MNIIFPQLATVAAVILWVLWLATTTPSSPKSGDRRIVKRADRYYLESYRDHPHWCQIGSSDFDTLEAAKERLKFLQQPEEVVEEKAEDSK